MTRRCHHCDCPQADPNATSCSLCGVLLSGRGPRLASADPQRVARLVLLLGGVVLGLFLLNRCCQFLLSPNRTAIKAVEECVGPPVTSDSTGRLTVGIRIADVPDAIGYGGDYGLEAMSDLPTRGGGRFTAAWRNGRALALLLHEGRVTEVREGRWGAREGFMEAGYTDGYSNWQSSVRGEWRHGGGPPPLPRGR